MVEDKSQNEGKHTCCFNWHNAKDGAILRFENFKEYDNTDPRTAKIFLLEMCWKCWLPALLESQLLDIDERISTAKQTFPREQT